MRYHIAILLLLLSPFLPLPSSSTLVRSVFYIGPTLVNFLYDDAKLSTCQVSLVKTEDLDSTQPIAWFQCLYSNSTTQFPTCRQTSQKRIVWGPIGCSNIASPAEALQSGNCISTEAELQRRLSIFLQTFSLSKDSVACYELGGAGDIRLCPGPLRLSTPNEDPLIPISVPLSTEKYIAADFAFIDAATGPGAGLPVTFEVPLVWPEITVTRTSVDICDDGYLGNFQHWQNDPSDLILEEVSKTFLQTSATTHRLLLRRVGGSDSVDFQITFATTAGPAGSLYDFEWVSDTFVGDEDNVFSNWVYQVPWGTAIPFYPYPSGAEACQLVLSIPESYTPVLGDVPILTTANYALNEEPRLYFQSSVCSYRNCRPNDIGYEFYPNCPIGTRFGGDAVASHPLYPGLPVYVPPNPNSHYRLDCVEVYPQNETFRALNINPSQGATIYRTNLESEVCNAPFINTARILQNLNPNEKYTQCQKMRGWVEENGLYCSVGITYQSPCPLNWVYWDQRCFYKFNPQTELRFQSTLENAALTCRTLNQFAVPLVEVDEDTQTWIQERFLYLKTSLDAKAAFRTPSFNTAYCNCFLSPPFGDNTVAPCGCFDTTVLNEYQVIFPICYFPISTAEMEPEMADITVSLATAALLRYGQEGPNAGGFQLQCKCFNGMTFSLCTTTTCRVDTTASDALGTFQRKCLEGKGQCANNQPNICQCPPGRGPSASLFSSLSNLYVNRDWPCACPSSGRTRGLYKINNQTYGGPIQDVRYLPCDGSDHGICIVPNNTNDGYCVSLLRPNLQTNLDEPAYSGQATSCPNPIQTYKAITQNGPITTQFCNAKGTCCPYGQTLENQYVGDAYAKACYSNSGDLQTGCECDTGAGGPACTCPTPTNLAQNLRPASVKLAGVNYVYVDLKQTYFVSNVQLSPECLVPDEVQISNKVGEGPPSSTNCTLNTTTGVYDCPYTQLAYQYVVLKGFTYTQNCEIGAFLDWFTLCGRNGTGNPFAGRFFDIPQYRAQERNLEQQYVGAANLGCTSTECMCNSDWAGELCAAGVSSIRSTFIEGENAYIDAKYLCGETTLVPAALDPVAGRGEIDPVYKNCSCNPLSVSDLNGLVGDPIGEERFAGRACQCALIKNLDRGDLEMCAGHGVCLEPSFPLGWCEKPLEDLLADPLSEPYADQSDFTIQTVTDMTVVSTSYVIGNYLYTTSSPTAYPTKSPTDSPTQEPTAPTSSPTNSPTSPTSSPTKSPTSPTKSPTTSPTEPPYVLLYYANGVYNGASSTSPTTCSPTTPPTCAAPSVKQFRATSTNGGLQNLGYPSSSPVKGPTGGSIGLWPDVVTTGFSSATLASVGLNSGNFWTADAIGFYQSAYSCVGWTSILFTNTAFVGITSSVAYWSGGSTTATCVELIKIMCSCLVIT